VIVNVHYGFPANRLWIIQAIEVIESSVRNFMFSCWIDGWNSISCHWIYWRQTRIHSMTYNLNKFCDTEWKCSEFNILCISLRSEERLILCKSNWTSFESIFTNNSTLFKPRVSAYFILLNWWMEFHIMLFNILRTNNNRLTNIGF